MRPNPILITGLVTTRVFFVCRLKWKNKPFEMLDPCQTYHWDWEMYLILYYPLIAHINSTHWLKGDLVGRSITHWYLSNYLYRFRRGWNTNKKLFCLYCLFTSLRIYVLAFVLIFHLSVYSWIWFPSTAPGSNWLLSYICPPRATIN